MYPEVNCYDAQLHACDSSANSINCTRAPSRLSDVSAKDVTPCFTPDVMIATARGLVRAEDLVLGDRVVTRDNGLQEVRWIGRKSLTAEELAERPSLCPILIRKDCFSAGAPNRDLIVSPNHRVLLRDSALVDLIGAREGLVAAKHLLDRPGVEELGACDITYIHFMCENHEIVLSDGTWTESFQPGELSLIGIEDDQREELFELFPELTNIVNLRSYLAARPCLDASDIAALSAAVQAPAS